MTNRLLDAFSNFEVYMVAHAVPEQVQGMVRAAFVAGLCHGIRLRDLNRSPEAIVELFADLQQLTQEMHAEALSYVGVGGHA